MNRPGVRSRLQLTVAVLGIVLAACGGGGASDSTATTTTPTTAGDTTTAATTTTATATTTTATAGTTEAPTTTGSGDAALIAQGEDLFQNTAGGVGCASCHTPEATGDPTIGSLDIRGASFDLIKDALATRDPMSFLQGQLTTAQITAISAYLQTLKP